MCRECGGGRTPWRAPCRPEGTEPKAAKRKATANPRAKKAIAKPSASAAKIAKAEALIAEVDALLGAEHVKRVGDDDVQAAMETAASAHGAMTAE